MSRILKHIGFLIVVLGVSNSLNAQDVQTNQNRQTATMQQALPGSVMHVSEQDINELPEHATLRLKPVTQNEGEIGKAYYITREKAMEVLAEKAKLRAKETKENSLEEQKEILPINNDINKNKGGQ